MSNLHVVTGAFGLIGRHIAQRLLEKGFAVRTLTGKPREDSPYGRQIEVHLLNFGDPTALTESLRGASVLYNTYWVRFPHGGMTHEKAVENSRTLFRCAAAGGVKRIVHISITNPDSSSPLTYFRGKAQVEQALINSGLSYSILRPAVLFGGTEILINNIAWMLRRLPVFGLFGDGRYQLQPTFVEDLADLAIAEGVQRDNKVLDAVGPERYAYIDLVQLIRQAVQSRSPIIRLPPTIGLAIGRLIGWWQNDVPITRQEIEGLMGNLLVSHQPPTCSTRFSEWLEKNGDRLGGHYQSELSRRRSQASA